MNAEIRILIADDHPIVRDGLEAVLATQVDFRVIGSAANGREVLEILAGQPADILLLDLEMPVMDGVDTVRALQKAGNAVRIIAFTVYDSDERIIAAVKAGAHGYLLKGTPREEIFQAIREVNAGKSLLQPLVASKLLQHIREDPLHLTARELEVLGLLGKGLTNREIAGILKISERTVKFHLSSIFGKLDVENRTEAVSVAVQRGIIAL